MVPNACGIDDINVEALGAKLDAIMADATPQVMSAIVAYLSRPKIFKALVNTFNSNEKALAAIFQKSYRHDNGFEKWVLLEGKNYKLRLHKYEDSRNAPQENRHNHSWDFASSILEGTLQNTIYTESLSGEEELNHYKYTPVNGEEYSTAFQGKKRLSQTTDICQPAGSAYFMPAEVIHRISYEQTFKERTTTLMLTAPRKQLTCDLYSEKAFETETTKVQQRFNNQDFNNTFKSILNNISK